MVFQTQLRQTFSFLPSDLEDKHFCLANLLMKGRLILEHGYPGQACHVSPPPENETMPLDYCYNLIAFKFGLQ